MAGTIAGAAVAVVVLLPVDNVTALSHEGRRILFTLAGVGIAVIVLLLAGLLQKRTAKPALQARPAAQTPQARTA